MRSTPRSHQFMIHEFVIEGHGIARKVLQSEVANVIPVQETANAQLAKTVLCLRTFKEGFVAYGWVQFKFAKFCPLVLPSYGSVESFARPGLYSLSAEDVSALPEHARLIFTLSESALVTACARLADAEARLRSEDQLLDAVIGMEAILLAGLDKKDRRSELKYRFSLNYSTLFDSPQERWRAYNVAKDLYDARSTIAHGGDLRAKLIRLGEEKLSVTDSAKRAKDILRWVIKYFLPRSEAAPYKSSKFWEQAYFRVPTSQNH